MEFVRQTWGFRADPRLKPFVERAAAAELRRPAEMLRKGLERRGVLKRADLTGLKREAADRTEASE